MTAQSTYLDYNATAPLKPLVIEAMTAALQAVGNASSVHRHGRLAHRALEDARGQVAQLLHTQPARITFTSGGTEANTLAIKGAVEAKGLTTVIVSAIEHDAVLQAAAASGADVLTVPVCAKGVVRVDALRDIFITLGEKAKSTLVSVMLVNNETGVVQPIDEIVSLAHDYGALIHTDAVQALGKVDVNFDALGCDLLSVSAHKLAGPQGTGALAIKAGLTLAPQMRGGGQENRLRAGTENLPAIVGFGAACQAAQTDRDAFEKLAELRDGLESAIAALAPEAVFYGQHATRLANTSCFAVAGLKAETQVMAMDLAGVSISAGSACSSGKVTPSHVLKAMGVQEDIADCAIRVSLGWASTQEDVDRFVAAWAAHYTKKKESGALQSA